jgi:glycosyltransferase involved in cell wall biosynthesis
MPKAELHLFTGEPKNVRVDDYRRFGVVRRSRITRSELATELMNSRVMLCPGHWHETYCFAAAEATLAGVPIVSCGIGALSERVTHGVNGYIATEQEKFGNHVVDLLVEDDRWLALHFGAMTTRDLTTWDECAQQWTRAFLT